MALFHFSVTQVKRSAGQSAIASAAYRAGEKLYSEYYGEVSDYTRKKGVVTADILLPPQAPAEYKDRQTLWNTAEKAERGKNAQLAYSFDIALQNEFSLDENIALARQFLSEHLLSRGMVIDYAIHEPDTEDGGIPNPHFHALCPIRPIDENGKWGMKQHRVYELDEGGDRIRDEAGNYVFNAVPTTDWGSPETLEAWRQAWAEICNTKFAEKGLDCRIDNRSYARQGIDLIPTKHEGPTVRAMEAKGIRTEKGELNRWIRATNKLIREAKQKIAALFSLLKEVKVELAKPREPTLIELLNAELTERNAGAWSNRAKVGNLKNASALRSYLTAHNLTTVDDLMDYMRTLDAKIDSLKAASKSKSERIKEVDDLLRMTEYYAEGKPVYNKMNSIKFKGGREKYQHENEAVLRRFYMAQQKLKPFLSSEGKLPITPWRKELASLKQEYEALQIEMKPIYAEVKQLWTIRYTAERALDKQRRQDKSQTQKHEQEL
ncbi:MAG TPA: MobQ family relaxase [Bacillota bacterium]|nr:MobQ family relaxase [Bacillota bacterium]HQQ43787.1 MobQ family relaxase [Bacillota bacterium]